MHAEPLDTLHLRTSEKWTAYPPEALPLFVAEMDYPLAPGISRVLHERIAASDSGYVGSPGEPRWGWRPARDGIRTATDVSVAIVATVVSVAIVAIVETLRRLTARGDAVVITTPVYPPFREFVREVDGVAVDVPLLLDETRDAGYRLDLDGLDAAREVGITVTSASKGFNLAGFKCALLVAESQRCLAVLDAMSFEVGARTSILGSTRASRASATTSSGSTGRAPRSNGRALCSRACSPITCRASDTATRTRASSPSSTSALWAGRRRPRAPQPGVLARDADRGDLPDRPDPLALAAQTSGARTTASSWAPRPSSGCRAGATPSDRPG